jgi:16S rRNA processing protein RimM
MSRSQPDPSWRPERVTVGRIGKPHGLDGSVHLTGHGGAIPMEPGTAVLVGQQEAVIVSRKGTAERPILRFDIASSRNDVEALRGLSVTVEAGSLPDTPDDEFFHVDLLGCTVRAGERELGVVVAVHEYPANDALELDSGDLVPFVDDVVEAVDPPARLITVREDLF